MKTVFVIMSRGIRPGMRRVSDVEKVKKRYISNTFPSRSFADDAIITKSTA